MCEDPNDSLWKIAWGRCALPKLGFQEKNHFCPLVATEEQEFLIELHDNTHRLKQGLGSQHRDLSGDLWWEF